MKVKVGDKVKVLAGKYKGKEGNVIKTLKKDNKVVVEGVNVVKKHVKPNRFNEVGSIQEMEAPIHVSNVKLVENTKKAEKPAKKEVKEAKEVKETKTAKKATTKKTVKKAS
jgi:large subunit ribosomal protein L24